MYKIIIIICFYVPLVISCLNIQGLISQFISPSASQLVAYLNLMLLILGTILFRQNIMSLSNTNKLWFIFYILYYSFGLLASGVSGFQTSIIATFVPVIYFIGFYFLLSNTEQFKVFFKVITTCFVISSFVTIILIKLNINAYTGEEHGWALDRAGGITGDPNAAAYTSIFAYILFNQLFQPKTFLFRLIKVLILATLFYSLFLTYSTTGLFVFTIVFFLINHKFFTGIKLVLIAVIIPLFYTAIFALKSQVNSLGLSAAQTGKVNNIINLLTFNLEDVDSSGRSNLIERALYYLYENPILGNGVDFAIDQHVHNTYIVIWVDAGLFTFLFFIFMLGYFFLKTLTLSPEIRYFGMSILIVLYIFMVSLQSVINQPNLIVFFVFVGYLIDHNTSKESLNTLKTLET